METQPVNAHISTLSRMNAFYGIPNLSQETTAAVDQGAPAPEVYSPKEAQPQQAPEDTNTGTGSATESFFTTATEQVEISDQAMALQQQSQALAEPVSSGNSAAGETQPESPATELEQLNSQNAGSAPTTGSNNTPTPTSALNAETSPSPLEDSAAAVQPGSGYAEQPGPINQLATGPGGNPNAGQPGALFSALG